MSGSPYGYLPLAGQLDAGQPVYALEAPGYDNGQPPAASLAELSGAYLRSLRRIRPDRAYCLLGWSMGGVVAYDMARRLAAAGVGVPLLLLIDTMLPSALPPPPGGAERLRAFVTDLLALSNMESTGLDGLLAGPPQPPEACFGRLIAAGIIPDGIDVDFLLARYRLFEAHIELLARYQISSRYAGGLTLIRAAASRPELMSWHEVAGEVRAHVVPGDHYSIWRGEGLTALGHAVRLSLAQALPPVRGARVMPAGPHRLQEGDNGTCSPATGDE